MQLLPENRISNILREVGRMCASIENVEKQIEKVSHSEQCKIFNLKTLSYKVSFIGKSSFVITVGLVHIRVPKPAFSVPISYLGEYLISHVYTLQNSHIPLLVRLHQILPLSIEDIYAPL